jgi:antitoxin YefM
MIVTNISDFRKDIKPYFDRVTKNFETLSLIEVKIQEL